MYSIAYKNMTFYWADDKTLSRFAKNGYLSKVSCGLSLIFPLMAMEININYTQTVK
jgi:hypothetical protein